MTISLKQTGEAAKSIWAVYVILAALCVGIVWAGDSRYVQLADGGKITLQIKVDSLQEDIDDLSQELKYEQDARQVIKLERTIDYKKNKVDALIKKYNLSQ